ncbi:MAG: hypothetical protein JWM90_2997 [Thermoleophilia bacterium]|nr:hypothetical protein [Thermoleophilia bacterium]
MTDLDLTTAQYKVFNRAFDKCKDFCDALLAALRLPEEHRSWQMLRAMSEAVIVAYCVPFYRNDDDMGARFSLPKELDVFHEPELKAAHLRLLELRAGVAHCDMSVTGERYTLESAPGLDEHSYTEFVLSERSVRLIRYMADHLEGSMFTLGWFKRREEAGATGVGTSTRLHIDERLEVLDDAAWAVLSESFNERLSGIASDPDE